MPSRPRRPPAPAPVRTMPAVLLIIGAVTHFGWLLEVILPTTASLPEVLPGDLYVLGEPYRQVFRGITWLTGAVFIAATPPLLRISPVHWRGRLTAIAVCLLGVLLLIHATYPPDHPVTGAPPDTSRAGTATQDVHHVVSVLLMLHYIVSPGTLLLWWRGVWRVLALVVFLFELLAGLAVGMFALLGPEQFIGLPARMQLVGATAMLGIGAVYVLKIGRGRSEREKPRQGRSPADEIETEDTVLR